MKKLNLFIGIFGAIYTIILVTVSALISPNFSWVNNYLSDIGAGKFGLEPQLLFNSTLVIGGLLMALFFILTILSLKKVIIEKISLIIMIIGSISLAMIGIFTEHAPYNLHFTFSMGFFLLFPVAMIILGGGYIKKNIYFAALTIIMALLALVIIMNLVVSGGKALPEIGEAIVLSIWVFIYAIFKYKEKD